MNPSEDVRKSAADSSGARKISRRLTRRASRTASQQAISEEEALKKGMEEPSAARSRVEGFEPSGGEREDFCAAKGRRPKLREQLSQFVEKGAEVYAKA